MGTRHLQVVIDKKGTERVRQYGQWDGYPEGQGVDILNFFTINKNKLKEYQANLEKIRVCTEAELDEIFKKQDWDLKYPHLSRDCGARIHKLILDGKVPSVSHIDNNEARRWCEGFYTIDFKKNVFIAEYYDTKRMYSLNSLPSKAEFLKDFR
jgi:hypothetical protein